MKAVMIVVGVLLVLVVGGLVVVSMNLGSVIKQGIERGGPEVLQVAVEVSEVDVSLFSGRGSIRGFTIANPEGFEAPHALSVQELSVELDVGTLDQSVIHIHEILLDGPLIVFEGGLTENNFKQLQQNIEGSLPASEGAETSAEASETDSAQAPKVRIGRFRLRNAEVRLGLDMLDEPESLTLDSLELTDFGSEDLTLAAASERILAGIRNAVRPLVQERVEAEAKARLEEKGRELIDDASQKVEEKIGNKLKGLLKR